MARTAPTAPLGDNCLDYMPSTKAIEDASFLPEVAVLRNIAFLSICGAFVNAVAPYYSHIIPSLSKSAKSIRHEGLMVGLQGMIARWLFRQHEQGRCVDDLLIPGEASVYHSHALNYDHQHKVLGLPVDSIIIGELEDAGVPVEAAQRCERALATASVAAVAVIRRHTLLCSATNNPNWNDASTGVFVNVSSQHVTNKDRSTDATVHVRWSMGSTSHDEKISIPNKNFVTFYNEEAALLPWFNEPFDLYSCVCDADSSHQRRVEHAQNCGKIQVSELFSDKVTRLKPMYIPVADLAEISASQPDVHCYVISPNQICIELPNQIDLQLHWEHYVKLRWLYNHSHTCTDFSICQPRFHTHLFVLLASYETLSGNSSGFQGALTDPAFKALQQILSIQHECFASPLNSFMTSFNSLLVNIDSHFGSKGNFFAQTPIDFLYSALSRQIEKCRADGNTNVDRFVLGFQANPPFVNQILERTFQQIYRIFACAATTDIRNFFHCTRIQIADAAPNTFIPLAAPVSSTHQVPLTFIIITPGWSNASWDIEAPNTPWFRRKLVFTKGQHEYKDGIQWRSERSVWTANTASFWFIFQNEAADALQPITELRLQALQYAVQNGNVGR